MSELPDDKMIYMFRGHRLEDMTREELIEAMKVAIRFQTQQRASQQKMSEFLRQIMPRQNKIRDKEPI